jgi:hypothetical protein
MRRWSHDRPQRYSETALVRAYDQRVNAYIVSLTVPTAELRRTLETVEGVRFVRELPPRRVVVTAPDSARLLALPGVATVAEDRLERPVSDSR